MYFFSGRKITGSFNFTLGGMTLCINLRPTPVSICTLCLKSLDTFYIVSYYINWVKTSWTYVCLRTIPNTFGKGYNKSPEKEREQTSTNNEMSCFYMS